MTTWKTKSSKIVYENPWIFVREDEIVMPNGKDGLYGVVESKSNSVFVVPVDEDNNTYLVQQAHYTTQELDWQCVAGRTDGEAPEIAAKRELLEEAGLRAESVTVLIGGRTAAGITTFRTAICIARDLHPDTSLLDEAEGITNIKKVSLETAKEMIFRGEIKSTESIAALLVAIAHVEKS